jgi:hypothetical protein
MSAQRLYVSFGKLSWIFECDSTTGWNKGTLIFFTPFLFNRLSLDGFMIGISPNNRKRDPALRGKAKLTRFD